MTLHVLDYYKHVVPTCILLGQRRLEATVNHYLLNAPGETARETGTNIRRRLVLDAFKLIYRITKRMREDTTRSHFAIARKTAALL